MSGPESFKQIRELGAENASDILFSSIVHDRPYMPNLYVDMDSILFQSVIKVAVMIVSKYLSLDLDTESKLFQAKKVTGGITNALFAVSGFTSNNNRSVFDSVLVRVFGAEGMIDRDVETSTFACLCDAGIAPGYLGRFKNGRVESWLENFVPLGFDELSNSNISQKIARKMAELHKLEVKGELQKHHSKPGMWDQLFSWMEQAKTSSFKTDHDKSRAKDLDLEDIEKQLIYLKQDIVPQSARQAFSHNDLLAGNIMKQTIEPFNIQLIDFEYGGCNFVGFDIANHFNEWAGGTDDAKPDYSKTPSSEQQRNFVKAYLSASTSEIPVTNEQVDDLLNEVKAFILANHLYWGLWAVNQASAEGCEDFDYLLYASNRFSQYRKEVQC